MSDIAFTVSLTGANWDQSICAWRCSALRVPGKVADSLYSGGTINPDNYRVDIQQQLVQWLSEGQPPAEVAVGMHLTQELTSKEVTARWKAAAIWLPPVVAVVVALIPLLWAKFVSPAPVEDVYETYHIHGKVPVDNKVSEATMQSITIALRPPHLQPNTDGTFDDDIPVRVSRGVPTFPDLLFSPLPGEVEPIVHLDKKWLGYGGTNYAVMVEGHNIAIANPIIYSSPPIKPYDLAAAPLPPALAAALLPSWVRRHEVFKAVGGDLSFLRRCFRSASPYRRSRTDSRTDRYCRRPVD